MILEPDFPENKEDWPFMWGEMNYLMADIELTEQLVNNYKHTLYE
jgi:endoglucanase